MPDHSMANHIELRYTNPFCRITATEQARPQQDAPERKWKQRRVAGFRQVNFFSLWIEVGDLRPLEQVKPVVGIYVDSAWGFALDAWSTALRELAPP